MKLNMTLAVMKQLYKSIMKSQKENQDFKLQ